MSRIVGDLHAQQLRHLSVEVIFDDIDTVMRQDEVIDLLTQRQCPDTQIIGLNIVCAQAVTGFLNGRISTDFLLTRGPASTDSAGSSVIPSPIPTIWRSVSRLVARTSSRPFEFAPQTSSA